MRRARFLLPALTVAMSAVLAAPLAACSTGAGAPDFTPSPKGGQIEGSNAIHLHPIEPKPPAASRHHSSSGAATPGSGGGSGSRGNIDPLVVATHLRSPIGEAVLPDGTTLVGERRSGRIVRVQPRAGQPVRTVRTLTGLDTVGGGGLLDLAISPDYTQDNLIYAYISTRTDNRVVDFTLHGPVTPVFTGIPRGHSDNGGRIAFGGDGDLYIGTGDAGSPRAAGRDSSLAGKVLRISQIGQPAAGNPRRGSAVFDSGHRLVDGLCVIPDSRIVLSVEPGEHGAGGEVNVLAGGADYGYPTSGASSRAPVTTLPKAVGAPGGCAVLGDRLWVTSLDEQELLSAPLRYGADGLQIGAFVPVLAKRYGRLKTVVAAPDGALWITTSNRDGHGHPVPDDERVIRYKPSSNGSGVGRTT